MCRFGPQVQSLRQAISSGVVTTFSKEQFYKSSRDCVTNGIASYLADSSHTRTCQFQACFVNYQASANSHALIAYVQLR